MEKQNRIVAGLSLIAGCSGDDGNVARPAEPSAASTSASPSLVGEATVSGPLSGGQHGFPQTSTPVDLAAAGYVEEEFLLAGEEGLAVDPLDVGHVLRPQRGAVAVDQGFVEVEDRQSHHATSRIALASMDRPMHWPLPISEPSERLSTSTSSSTPLACTR